MRIDVEIDLPLLILELLIGVGMNTLKSTSKRYFFHCVSVTEVADLILSCNRGRNDKPPDHRN